MSDIAETESRIRAIVAAWQGTLDHCGMDLWQVNRQTHEGKWGEGPVNLEHLAREAVEALAALHIDGSGPMASLEPQPTHRVGCWRVHHECAVAIIERLIDGAIDEAAMRLIDGRES